MNVLLICLALLTGVIAGFVVCSIVTRRRWQEFEDHLEEALRLVYRIQGDA